MVLAREFEEKAQQLTEQLERAELEAGRKSKGSLHDCEGCEKFKLEEIKREYEFEQIKHELDGKEKEIRAFRRKEKRMGDERIEREEELSEVKRKFAKVEKEKEELVKKLARVKDDYKVSCNLLAKMDEEEKLKNTQIKILGQKLDENEKRMEVFKKENENEVEGLRRALE